MSIAENAIKHGIEPSGEQGTVIINVWIEDEWLKIEVRDTGCGFEVEETLKKKKSEAINNIINRLYLLNDKAKAEFKSEINRGTNVNLTIPVVRSR